MTAVRPWPPAQLPPLEPGDVQLWSARLDGDPDSAVLDDAERERAARFVSDELTRRWTNARATLRAVLAAHASVEPAAVRIEQAPCVHCGEPHGKPFLADPAAADLRFNLSHSGGLALIAVARGREVGVDLEAIRPRERAEAMAERWFTAAEAEHVRALSGEQREAAFYMLWARKEAYLKATAAGMRGGLRSFDALEPKLPAGWSLTDVDAGPGHAAALAVAPPGYSPGG